MPLAVTFAVDHTRQRPRGNTQVVAGVAPTLRPANRQYPAIAADLNYTPPSFNAFDRLTDVDTPIRSYQNLGGASAERRLEAGPRASDVHHRLALLGLEAVERPRLHRPARHLDLRGAVLSDAVDAGGALRGRSRAEGERRGGRVLLPAGPRLRSVVQAGAGLGGRALPAGADARAADAGPARRLRLQPVPAVPQHQCRGVRPARVARHRPAAADAGPAV